MLVCDVFWWSLVLPLLPKRSWRIALNGFMAFQILALFSVVAGSDWPRHVPTIFLALVTTWHYLALPAALMLVLLVKIKGRRLRARGEERGARSTAAAFGNAGEISSPTRLSRREFLGACAAMAPPLFNVGLTGLALAQVTGFRVRRFTLSVPSLPKALDGLTIAQVSDIHIGRMTRGAVLEKIVRTTNDLRADMVVMTGDLIDYELADLATGIDLVRRLEGKYGLWMVEGNHDLFEDADAFHQRVKAAGISFLRNESALATVRGYPVQLFGLPWFGASEAHRAQLTATQMDQMMRQRHPDAFPVLLAHHPHAFDDAVRCGLPLTLSGHTHGGYWMFDEKHGVGSAFFKYWSGWYARGNSQLIVSNGVGNWAMLPPIRINAPAEIVHLTLRAVV